VCHSLSSSSKKGRENASSTSLDSAATAPQIRDWYLSAVPELLELLADRLDAAVEVDP
jgi:hypothetical protein